MPNLELVQSHDMDLVLILQLLDYQALLKKKLKEEIDKRYETTTVFPEKQNIFYQSLLLTFYSNLFVSLNL